MCEKKTSFKRRVLVFVLALTLVFAMALPCFAAYGTYPEGYAPSPVSNYLIMKNSSDFYLFDLAGASSFKLDYRFDTTVITIFDSSGNLMSFNRYNRSVINVPEGFSSTWKLTSSAPETFYQFSSAAASIMYCSYDIALNEELSTEEDPYYDLVIPPPPDFRESVNSGLSAVIDWIGSVVSSLMSGELNGLLLLVALPIAITLVFFAAVWIRRLIWGA